MLPTFTAIATLGFPSSSATLSHPASPDLRLSDQSPNNSLGIDSALAANKNTNQLKKINLLIIANSLHDEIPPLAQY